MAFPSAFCLLHSVLLLAGCQTVTRPPEMRPPRSNVSAHVSTEAAEQEQQADPSPPDYLVSRTPAVRLDVLPATATEKGGDKPVDKPTEPVDMRIQAEESSSPVQPVDPPQPRREDPNAALIRPDAPPVQVLRALLERHPEEEINEQLKPYDSDTREAMLLLLTSIAQLEQGGGMTRITPRDLAAWMDRLNTLTACLRGRAQLILDRMCFCSYIKNFGDFAPLPPEHTFFQPGEVAHVYVQVRNFSSRREQERYVTVLKGRLEIYDEANRDSPPITWASQPREDVSATPRQDYYINFRFQVPVNCPAGLYTMRIAVEDWTDAPSGAKQVPESRVAQRTIDFRVGGPIASSARAPIAETTPAP